MTTKVKICGITNLEDALAACDAGADALGFNFAEEAKAKKRYIAPEAAKSIIEKLPVGVKSIAVCVNEPTDRLREYLQFTDCVQLHGEESREQCEEVGEHAIKAFRLSEDFDLDTLKTYNVAAVLLDAAVPGARGGTGQTCDWDRAGVAAGITERLVLAGGLTPENVAEAVKKVRPYAVDTAGGVESEPGKKDHERIRSFVKNAKISLS